VDVERAAVNLAWIVVPVIMFAFLVLGLWYRRRSPFWLPVAAAVALAVPAAHSAVVLPAVDALTLVWCLLGIALLAMASVAVARGWSSRGALVVAGLILPAPLMASLFAVSIVYLASR
jgi:hypothetical protein